jgi:hypothetical protein
VVLFDMLSRVGLIGGENTEHSDPPEHCDICSRRLLDYRWFVDGEQQSGEWANMCLPCFVEHGDSIAWGHGQLYLQGPDQAWRMISGGDSSG